MIVKMHFVDDTTHMVKLEKIQSSVPWFIGWIFSLAAPLMPFSFSMARTDPKEKEGKMFAPFRIGWLKDSRSSLKVLGFTVIRYVVESLVIDIACWLCFTQAPGEAEAELAYLNKIHAIDLVLTSDSDAFLFGATHVMRRLVEVILKYFNALWHVSQPPRY